MTEKMTKILTVKRVPYGADDTSMENREYMIDIFSPVGTRKEFIELAKRNEIESLTFVERDGSHESVDVPKTRED